MALRATRRSPPDGKSSPPRTSDTAVIIPGFISKSCQLNIAKPSPAAVPLTRAPKPTPRTSKVGVKSASWHPSQSNYMVSSSPNQFEDLSEYNGNMSPNQTNTASISNMASPARLFNSRVSPLLRKPSLEQPPGERSSRSSGKRHSTSGRMSSVDDNTESLRSSHSYGQPLNDPQSISAPNRQPDNSKDRPYSSTSPLPPPQFAEELFAQSKSGPPTFSPNTKRLVSAPVSRVIEATRSGSVHGTQKMARTLHVSEVNGGMKSVARPPEEHLTDGDSQMQPLQPLSLSDDPAPLSPVSPSRLNHKAAPDIPPYFIHPLNLCDPFVDNIGLMEICSLRVDDLQFLSQTNQNKPIMLRNGRTVPSFLVRIWSRGSGKYLDILSVGEVYGRGLFGHNERLRLIVVGQRTVMVQSTRDPRLHISIQNGMVTGQGSGNQDCHFLIHQGPTGYCLLESLLYPGCFLGVRKNGNIMRPSQVNPNATEARFVIQKETLGTLM